MSNSGKQRKLVPLSVWDQQAVLQAFAEHNVKQVHAIRLWSYLLRHPGSTWADVPHMPKAGLAVLERHFSQLTSRLVDAVTSRDGEATKLLIELQDGLRVEAVLMTYDTTGLHDDDQGVRPSSQSESDKGEDGQSDSCSVSGKQHGQKRATLCVSSQVGCQMGCTFCATGTMGLKGNLCSGEIVEQLVHALRVTPVRNVVFMGMGEPLANYSAVLTAVRMMTDQRYFGLSRRRVTISTVGVVPRIRTLAEDLPGISLALSLHAPTQAKRVAIVPSARAYKLEQLMDAVYQYQEASGQRVFVEYVMLAGVNDDEATAHELGCLLQGRNVVVNLIPWNPIVASTVSGPVLSAPTAANVTRFHSTLRSAYNLAVTIRQEKGQDIAGACGQLVVSNLAKQDKLDDAKAPADIEDCSTEHG